VESVTSMESKR